MEAIKHFFKKFYQAIKKTVIFVNTVIVDILLTLLFYLIFAPVGIFLRMTRQDLLDLKRDTKRASYWKSMVQLKKNHYLKQY